MQDETSAGVVIFHKGKERQYLLLNYTENPRSESKHWDFTKGRVEEGEELQETAVREAKEETGLDVKIIPGFIEKINYNFTTKQGDKAHLPPSLFVL